MFMRLVAKLGIELFRPGMLVVVDFVLVIAVLDGNMDELLLIRVLIPDPDVGVFISPVFPP